MLLSDVFKNSRNMCLETYERNPTKFILAPRLERKAALKKYKVKLDLLTDVLLMVEKSIRGGTCNSIYQYAKANNK